jgi:diguanylate cyclase (GGDEF)-like protein
MMLKNKRYLMFVLLPAAVAGAIALGIVFGLLRWGADEADRASISRQIDLVEVVVNGLKMRIAHDQESVTVWDDSVNAVQSTGNNDWLDANLGSWMNTYFGHDAAYVLDPNNAPIFSYTADDAVRSYSILAGSADRLARELRAKLSAESAHELDGRVLTPGASDIAVLAGRPAIVSVKPIVSDSGDIEQVPGTEHLHVAVRLLDGDFLQELERTYLFSGIRFSWEAKASTTEEAYPLLERSGRTVGYFVWEPYRPGTEMLARLHTPLLTVLASLVFIAMGLLWQLERRSRMVRERDDHLTFMALHDSLTGLANRVAFSQSLDRALADVRAEQSLALLYLDLDHFKEVNDTLGHPVGDELIRQFAARLIEIASPACTISRLGGDEFTIIVPHVTTIDEAEGLAAAIVDRVRQPFQIEGNSIFIGVTIGIAFAPFHGVDRNEITRKADIALYHAKSTGRSRYAVYGEDMDALLHTKREMERDLRHALESGNELEVHYQPLFNVGSSRVAGVEALLRWKHPRNGWVSPELFVPLAEERGLIEKLGEFVLRSVCSAAAHWYDLTVSINVSAIELRNPAYAAKVASALLHHGMPPHRLELELTESALIDATGTCSRNVDALRALGVKIALDDFGTGFSTLDRLRDLNVDRIKIDRSFIRGFGREGGDESIVRTIVELARLRGLKTTAEGVESVDQQDALIKMGCDDLQGFLFSRAIPARELNMLLNADRKVPLRK